MNNKNRFLVILTSFWYSNLIAAIYSMEILMSKKQMVMTSLSPKSSESESISHEQIMFFKKELEEKRTQIVTRIKNKIDNKENNENHSDESDKATAIETTNIELLQQERDALLLREIKLALSNIATNDYGFCENCGIEIGIKRLKINPSSRYCFDCKCNIETKLKNEKRISF